MTTNRSHWPHPLLSAQNSAAQGVGVPPLPLSFSHCLSLSITPSFPPSLSSSHPLPPFFFPHDSIFPSSSVTLPLLPPRSPHHSIFISPSASAGIPSPPTSLSPSPSLSLLLNLLTPPSFLHSPPLSISRSLYLSLFPSADPRNCTAQICNMS